MASDHKIMEWNATVNYKKFAVVDGIYKDSTYYRNPAQKFYATQDNINQYPSGTFSYTISSWNLDSEGTYTAYFTKGASDPDFTRGSLVQISASDNANANYTGMAIDGGSGYVKYIGAGWPGTGNAGSLHAPINPAWTTGFFFTPGYSSKKTIQNKTIAARLGDGYVQRQKNGLNNKDKNWDLVFDGRTDIEAKAIEVFIEDKAGVYPFDLLVPVGSLENKPNNKYVGLSVDVSPASFGLNNITVSVERDYNI